MKLNTLKRRAALALAAAMLFAALPMTALADEPAPPDADAAPPIDAALADEPAPPDTDEAPPADEVTYNTGRAEVTVGCDEEKAENEDLDIWYALFDEDGGHTIDLDLFDADPLFPYEVQFKYQGVTETRWFETIDDTVEVNGHLFSLSCTNSQPRTIGLWVGDEYFPARPVAKEFTNEGGFGAFSMQPLTENRLTQVDLSSKLGIDLEDITVSGGPASGVWTIAGTDNYQPFDASTKIDLSPYMGESRVTLELINGDDPLDSSFTRYIVQVALCDVSQLLDFQAYVGDKAVNSSLYRSVSYYNVNVTWPKWSLEPATLKMKLGSTFSGKGYTADVYLGQFATEDEAKAADPSANITGQIWDDGTKPDGPGYGADYSKQPWFTVVFKKDGKTVYVYNTRVYMYDDINYRTHTLLRNFDGEMVIDENTTLELGTHVTYGNDNMGNLIGGFAFYKEADQTIPAETSLKLDFSASAGSDLPTVKVYKGAYQTKAELDAAIAANKTQEVTPEIWGDTAAGVPGNYSRWDKSPRFTLLLERGSVPEADWAGDTVLPVSGTIYNPSASIYIGYSLYRDNNGTREWVTNDRDEASDYTARAHSGIFTLPPQYAANDTYYAELGGSAMGEPFTQANLDTYIQKAVVGRCATADEVNAAGKADIKDQLFSDAASSSGGYGADYSRGVTFTVLDVYGKLHYATIRVVAAPTLPAQQPNPLSDDTYFRAQGANKADGNAYSSYSMNSADDSYYYNGYQTVFLLDNGGPVTDTEIYPTFWTGNKVNVYAALNTASGDKVESGQNAAQVTFGTPINYSAGSESGTHLKNYWVTFVTKKENGPALFVNGATNSKHLDEETGQPVREVFLNAGRGYHHDIFFANIGDAQMTGLKVELSADAENIALDDYWQIKGTKTLAAFTSVDSTTTSYGELANVSKIRLVPKKNADGTLASGEISGTLTISYDGGDPVVIKLTGTAAKPRITTTDIVPGVKYVHYSSVIQTDNMYNADGVEFKIAAGTLPRGLTLKPNGELYGVPTVNGSFKFTVQALYNGAESDRKEFTLSIKENSDTNVWDATDSTYDITTAIPNADGTVSIPTMDKKDNSFSDPTQLFVSEGEYAYFVELRLDGKRLVEGTDYTKEPGSTRITIQTQTLKNAGGGTHTLSGEFREGDTMRRASQNYKNAGSSKPTPTPTPTPTPGPGGATGSGSAGGQAPAKPAVPFTDVSEKSWYYNDVKWAFENEIMVGISSARFDPVTPIDQATVVTVLARMAKVELTQFSADGYDNITSGRWYSSAAVWATQAGLLPNDTAFVEAGAISRGNMAIMLTKYLQSVGVDTSLPSPLVEFADADLMTRDEFNAFQVLYRYGIFRGVGGLRMNPTGATSRCEFSALMHRMDALIKK